MTRRLALAVPALLASLLLAVPDRAAAFCGFYVSGADAKLYNNATQVVLMRDGTRTVLSMQNNYQGPPQDFAMVVPVPVVLQEADVKTLERSVFDRVDQLAAPRLVEYWEQDPCPPPPPRERRTRYKSREMMSASPADAMDGAGYGVRIEAKFAVGEYQILILGAEDSTGLDRWLRANNYKIPVGAAEVLRPYVQAGQKFFVAKVDVKKVSFDAKGQAQLSPLRFHYDSDTFALPVRLGLLNARGKQDLIVHVLARQIRYEMANYDNVAIPSNLEVTDNTRQNFPGFYAALFDRVLERHPSAVVTEYAWASGTCDPCPTPPLEPSELMVLGADVMPDLGGSPNPGEFVLTRLHARYGAENLGEDLVFRAGPPIVGGREGGGPGNNEEGATVTDYNNFQARYIIRHPWTGPIKCRNPQRGIWGGPPGGGQPPAIAARDLAFIARDAPLKSYLQVAVDDIPALPGERVAVDPYPRALGQGTGAPPSTVEPGPPVPLRMPTPPPTTATGGCASCDVDRGAAPVLLLLAVAALVPRRRRRP
jgi:MYXO-CTERM domain-containing protein